MLDKNIFKNPPRELGICMMAHVMGGDLEGLMAYYEKCGHAGAVINPPEEHGFTSNPDNIAHFGKVIKALKDHGLSYWIYDEAGYPSGQARGLSLEGHPEFEAKGFYMHRRIAYEPTHAVFNLDDESDRIIWAAKYPVETPGRHESFVQFDKMTPVPFTKDRVECDLEPVEILYVFCVKPAYEGSHSTHNVSSFRRNLNIMDKAAVRRFIDVAYEPTAAMLPDAYRDAVNVFTDEPSLHVWRARPYEVWNYAIAPWCDGLFEAYERDHGESLLPNLPLIFEGTESAYPTRVKFYETVAGMIAEAWSGQLSQWCEEHGCGFSGHYLLEESISHHVVQYGNFIKVLMNASYPGIDVLTCYPEIYQYTTAKYAQMAVRKKQSGGMMVEICPFNNKEEFYKDPVNNMTAVMGLLYLSGVRKTNSYFNHHLPEVLKAFNEYVARLGYMLDGLMNETSVFVYYGIEDVQAKTQPTYTAMWDGISSKVDATTWALTEKMSENNNDYYFIDRDDLRDAAKALDETGKAVISGNEVKVVVIPAMDVMYGESVEILRKLAEAGVVVKFADNLPRIGAEDAAHLDTEGLSAFSIDEILAFLHDFADDTFRTTNEAVVLTAKFTRDGKALHMLVNKSRVDARVAYKGGAAEVFSPDDGSTADVEGGEVIVPKMRAVFVLEK
ncbi:MAG: hypothetical protein E7638_05570 [Ruminococcaceae bacterium]|nr:hypothetical protein [Oscillospiraceae bacterium]